MKTILCPVDFTASSDRVAKYAAQLAHDTHAKVILVAAHPKKTRVPAGDWPEGRSEVMDRLGELHDLLTSMYHIPCGIEEEVISDKIYKKLSTAADHYDLLLLGVQTAKDGFPKEANGTNLVRMMQETLVPLYVVPDKFVYQKINALVYAYDYKHEPDAPMMTLHWLAEWFEAEMKFISVLQSNISVKEKDSINEIRHTLDSQWKSGRKLSFETIVHDDPPKGLEQYMDMQGNSHMLVLSVDHQNMLDRIWHKSVVKRIVKYASHPYMIIHK